jgi:16S rRNA (adenine1518-N6/adenine1519-N6)-dimethyltransferase
MVDAMELRGDETVLEIGGGRGAMTGLLAGRAARLVVVEIDRALAAELAERFRGDPTVQVVAADILDVNAGELLAGSAPDRTIAFGNIPYYASSPILLWLAENAARFARGYLTMQREVAERLTAPPGEKTYGSITVRMAYAAAARRLFAIAPGAFSPRPKVTSAFVRLVFHREPPVAVADEATLFRVTRAAFAQRRKTLRNALALLPGMTGEMVARAGERAAIDLGRRGETLALDEFARLADAVGEISGAGAGAARDTSRWRG